MNCFDFEIISYLNQFSQQSWIFDKVVGFLAHNHLLKGGILTTLIWWAWFKRDEPPSSPREQIIATLLSCVVAMAVARALAFTLPFRLRPRHEEGLHFLLPYGGMPEVIDQWSSFPSDHAVLFFALSTGLFLIQRTIGIFALLYSLVLVAFPRIYLGLHYPTDIIAGAIIGSTIALIGNLSLVKSKHIHSIVTSSYSQPHLFYPLFFLFTYQLADMFDDSRALISGVLKFLQGLVASQSR